MIHSLPFMAVPLEINHPLMFSFSLRARKIVSRQLSSFHKIQLVISFL